MARLALNKSTLTKKVAQLAAYRRFLPSLDLKRRQLMAERAKARRAHRATRQRLDEVTAAVPRELPMLADERVDLRELATVSAVRIGRQNVVGVELPVLEEVRVDVRPFSLLGKPHWVDRVAASLRDALALHVQEQVEAERLARIEHAVRITTQRVNLFEKVLIPRAMDEIKRVRLQLAEQERAAVVRAKISKAKKGKVA